MMWLSQILRHPRTLLVQPLETAGRPTLHAIDAALREIGRIPFLLLIRKASSLSD